jgi:hypothetical protein
MAADLGLYLNSINTTKKNVMRDPEADPSVVTGYPAFIVKRLLSYHEDCVLLVNELNKLPTLDGQMQYEYLLHALPKKRRFSKLHKTVSPENLDLIKKYYGYSDQKAMEVLDLHTPQQIEALRKELDEGGPTKRRRP